MIFPRPTAVIPGKVSLAEFKDPDGNRLRFAGPAPDEAALTASARPTASLAEALRAKAEGLDYGVVVAFCSSSIFSRSRAAKPAISASVAPAAFTRLAADRRSIETINAPRTTERDPAALC